MKMPSFAAGFGGGSSSQSWVAHVDKIVGALAAIAAGFVLWIGIETIRTKSVSSARSPGVIASSVEQARRHVQSGGAPPEDLVPQRRPLEEVVSEWQLQDLPPQESVVVFNRPLFGELAARSKPDILPVEQLVAHAGVAVLAARPVGKAAEKNKEDAPEKDEKRRPRRSGPPQSSQPEGSVPPGAMSPDPYAMGMPGAAAVEIPGRVVPYVIVTGLIPYRKQFKEYAERFEFASFTNPQLDTPSWGPFSIERAERDGDGKPGEWKRIDPREVQAKARREWVNVQKEALPPSFLLPVIGASAMPTAAEPSFTGACMPLPLLAQDRWGLEAVHPWFLKPLGEMQKKMAQSGGPGAAPGMGQMPGMGPSMDAGGGFGPGGFGPGGFGPGGFGPGGFGPGSSPPMNDMMGSAAMGSVPGMDMSSGSSMPGAMSFPGMEGGFAGPGQALRGDDGEEFRLFRFLDLDVQPDKSYLYRVRLALRNPNLGVPARYLKDASLATAPWLVSDHSQASVAVDVPTSVKILARTLVKDGSPASLKELKIRDGMAELLVLAESAESGRLSLRSVIAEPGGVLDVDESLNKSGGVLSFGETVKTGSVLLDVRGSQVDRADERGKAKGRESIAAEPLEALVLEPVGNNAFKFGIVDLVDSEHAIDVFRATLPKQISTAPATPGMTGPGQPYSP